MPHGNAFGLVKVMCDCPEPCGIGWVVWYVVFDGWRFMSQDSGGATSMVSACPNVVVILADDHRAEVMGCAGHSIVQTPHIDQLACEGVRFDHAFCTSPLCTPSRVSWLLGQWERRHGVNFGSGTAVSPAAWADSFPAKLRDAGYFTGYVGKNHCPVGEGGYAGGFMEDAFDFWYASHGHLGFYPKERHPIFACATSDTQAEIIAEGVDQFLGSRVDLTAFGAKMAGLSAWTGDCPFALLVNFNMPHRNGTSTMAMRPGDDEVYRTAYRGNMDAIPLPRTYVAFDDEAMRPKIPRAVYSRMQISSYDYSHTPAKYREHYVRYMQCITGVDRVVGRIVETLSRLGVLDNTIVIYSGDHGIQAGEHGLGGKALLYEESVRVPLVVRWPGLDVSRRGAVCSELVAVPDAAPTILTACGVKPPASMQGSDLGPLMRGEDASWRDGVVMENLMTIQDYPRSEGIRTQRWKYIRYFKRDVDGRTVSPDVQRWYTAQEDYHATVDRSLAGEDAVYEELFDLSVDADEVHNLAGEARCASILTECRQRCTAELRTLRGRGRRRVVSD